MIFGLFSFLLQGWTKECVGQHHKSFDSQSVKNKTENEVEGHGLICQTHLWLAILIELRKQLKFEINAIIGWPACGYTRQSMSLYPNPRTPTFKFHRATKSFSKCFT